ncbi:hypothetical protein T492DRAFT_1152244 [Pavlovales sp. CCMP2436]|nr:hypothetical protein T492DRAFT_1152244 [Pavlovales sp. CCMP2436]
MDGLTELSERLGAVGAALRIDEAPSAAQAAATLRHLAAELLASDERAHLLRLGALARARAAAALAAADAAGVDAASALATAAATARTEIRTALAPRGAVAAWVGAGVAVARAHGGGGAALRGANEKLDAAAEGTVGDGSSARGGGWGAMLSLGDLGDLPDFDALPRALHGLAQGTMAMAWLSEMSN